MANGDTLAETFQKRVSGLKLPSHLTISWQSLIMYLEREPTKKVTGEPSVIEMMTYESTDNTANSVKGSGSNPLEIKLPRYSKERIAPWNKQ